MFCCLLRNMKIKWICTGLPLKSSQCSPYRNPQCSHITSLSCQCLIIRCTDLGKDKPRNTVARNWGAAQAFTAVGFSCASLHVRAARQERFKGLSQASVAGSGRLLLECRCASPLPVSPWNKIPSQYFTVCKRLPEIKTYSGLGPLVGDLGLSWPTWSSTAHAAEELAPCIRWEANKTRVDTTGWCHCLCSALHAAFLVLFAWNSALTQALFLFYFVFCNSYR